MIEQSAYFVVKATKKLKQATVVNNVAPATLVLVAKMDVVNVETLMQTDLFHYRGRTQLMIANKSVVVAKVWAKLEYVLHVPLGFTKLMRALAVRNAQLVPTALEVLTAVQNV